MAKVNPVQLEKNLNALKYPLTKKDLVRYAEEKGVDEQVMRTLKNLPTKQYETLADISKSMNEIAMPSVNLVQLQKNLDKVNYPLSKKDLVKYAEETGVDEAILRVVKRLPAKEYQTLDDVSQAIEASESAF
ncbi:DUF2795 domain-containing protein [Nostocaceae cyanobacterium CENA369]|uniref:DUF2795 domain-containing protein n=1 Tax=Dendronalium phyllosphericum CENA369 TaxID=1725256 RepID=A0A8J7LI25_9NOST|nr:DUF2795 domain-containing protein [Dendronalium phyllosphericum]MBH8574584.1 DUF2795 domain-containing protein [Dendronalium phyllosphericum CENA369]